MATHFFTSAAINYLPKARVLAASIRRHHPEAIIHLVLCDRLPEWFQLRTEPFDALLTLDDLDLPPEPGWRFSHNLVELSTAIKGFALVKLLDLRGCDSVIYFDPDIVVLAPLEELIAEFQAGSILLTPHSTEPDRDLDVIEDNELVSLRHGTFNLGFLGVQNDAEGRRFAFWWRDRLRHFCFDNVPYGLFTDQRWADLIPSFFPRHRILTDAAYNVCTWNLNSRVVAGSLEGGLLVNDSPMVFYHFSGFDRGAQKMMLERYGRNMPALFDLRGWYKAACEQAGQSLLGSAPWGLAKFENGDAILQSHRDLYRRDARVRQWFPDPYGAQAAMPSFISWYRLNGELFAPLREASLSTAVSAQPCYRTFVMVEGTCDAQHALAVLAEVTASPGEVYVAGSGESLAAIDVPPKFTKLPLPSVDRDAIYAHLFAEFSDRDLLLVRAGVEPPIHWDLRLAWSAQRNEDTLTVSPLHSSMVDRNASNACAPDRYDRLAYWFRLADDPEIAMPFDDCWYLRAQPMRQLTADVPLTGLADLHARAAARGFRHRLATHLCVESTFSSENVAIERTLRNEIRDGQIPDTSLPILETVAVAPVLHIAADNRVPLLDAYCCSDLHREHLVLSFRGPAHHREAAFHLRHYRAGEWQSLRSWPSDAPIGTVSLFHSSYRSLLNRILEIFSPDQLMVWSLLHHSLDCLDTGLPTACILDSLALPDLFTQMDSALNQGVLRRQLARVLRAANIRILSSSSSAAESFTAALPEYAGQVLLFEDGAIAQNLREFVPASPQSVRYFAGPKAAPRCPGRALQLYWDTGTGLHEGASTTVLPRGAGRQQLSLQFPRMLLPVKSLRLDIGTESSIVQLFGLRISGGNGEIVWRWLPGSEIFGLRATRADDTRSFRLSRMGRLCVLHALAVTRTFSCL